MGYDDDALQALADGDEPSCHVVNGLDAIFATDWPTATLCAGYRAWTNDEPGFNMPLRARKAAATVSEDGANQKGEW